MHSGTARCNGANASCLHGPFLTPAPLCCPIPCRSCLEPFSHLRMQGGKHFSSVTCVLQVNSCVVGEGRSHSSFHSAPMPTVFQTYTRASLASREFLLPVLMYCTALLRHSVGEETANCKANLTAHKCNCSLS